MRSRIGMLFITAIESTLNTAAERDSSNGVTSDNFPYVSSWDLAKIPPREFNEAVLQQSQRLSRNRGRGICTSGRGVPRLQVCCSRRVLRRDAGEAVRPCEIQGRVGAFRITLPKVVSVVYCHRHPPSLGLRR
jgi:hypothetical protein